MPTLDIKRLIPGLSLDCVIFGFHENELKVLLLKMKNMPDWALPGGFVEKEESVDQAAVHVLKQRTGLVNIFLKQFHLFGEVGRNNHGHARIMVENGVIPEALFQWFDQRFVTVGYYALVEYSKVKKPQPDYISESCEWRSLKELPSLILDHKHILAQAHKALKLHLDHQPIGWNLLPKRFTMPELQALYETVLDKKLDRRNFQRKMLSYGILIRTGKRRKGTPHKAPMLYEFDEKQYHRALREGFRAGFL